MGETEETSGASEASSTDGFQSRFFTWVVFALIFLAVATPVGLALLFTY